MRNHLSVIATCDVITHDADGVALHNDAVNSGKVDGSQISNRFDQLAVDILQKNIICDISISRHKRVLNCYWLAVHLGHYRTGEHGKMDNCLSWFHPLLELYLYQL